MALEFGVRDYDGPIRQMLITDLGHEEPTVLKLVTNLEQYMGSNTRPLSPTVVT